MPFAFSARLARSHHSDGKPDSNAKLRDGILTFLFLGSEDLALCDQAICCESMIIYN